MNFFQWACAIIGGLFLAYLLGRLISAAYYQSKRDYERNPR